MAKEQVLLITGANRGIGRAMAATFLLRPSTIIVATVRDPSHESAQSLRSLPTGAGSHIVVLTLDMREDPSSIVSDLKGAGIDHLDVVIANAGSSTSFIAVEDTTPEHMRDDFEVNALGPFRLFQTCWPLLKNSQAGVKKFVIITSSVGSIANLEEENMPGVSYGTSKAAVNWVAKKLSVQFKGEGLRVGIIHPGWVQTAMGQALADAVGFPEPPMTIEDSTRQVVQRIDDLSDETSGKFLSYGGEELPW